MLRSYAAFCDVVLNKSVEAAQLRNKAELFESSGDDGIDELVSNHGEQLDHDRHQVQNHFLYFLRN